MRFCGPARAVLRVQGKSFTFTGGRCTTTRAGFGLLARNPGKLAQGRGFELVLQHHQRQSGLNPVIDGVYQLHGVVLAETPTGTAVIAKNLRSATFSLAAGPVKITGRWSCGTARLLP